MLCYTLHNEHCTIHKMTVINLARICAVLPNKALRTLKASISSFAQLKRGDKPPKLEGFCYPKISITKTAALVT